MTDKIPLSPHFTLGALTVTQNAALQALNRTSALDYIPALKALANGILEPIYGRFPDIMVTSGFRCLELNGATLGAAVKSQHMLGQAADMVFPARKLDDVFLWLRKESGLKFGQLILESSRGVRWIHISLGEPWRPAARCGQVLVMKDGKYEAVA